MFYKALSWIFLRYLQRISHRATLDLILVWGPFLIICHLRGWGWERVLLSNLSVWQSEPGSIVFNSSFLTHLFLLHFIVGSKKLPAGTRITLLGNHLSLIIIFIRYIFYFHITVSVFPPAFREFFLLSFEPSSIIASVRPFGPSLAVSLEALLVSTCHPVLKPAVIIVHMVFSTCCLNFLIACYLGFKNECNKRGRW